VQERAVGSDWSEVAAQAHSVGAKAEVEKEKVAELGLLIPQVSSWRPM